MPKSSSLKKQTSSYVQKYHLIIPYFKPFQMKLQGDKTGRKGHLSVATEVLS